MHAFIHAHNALVKSVCTSVKPEKPDEEFSSNNTSVKT